MFQPNNKFTIHPVINSRIVIIPAPMNACIQTGVVLGSHSFIKPIQIKQVPPNINIDQCEYPRNMISKKKYKPPPIVKRGKYLRSCLIINHHAF